MSKGQTFYEILDVSLNANPEAIRTAYIRAKNAYNRDSLAAYSLFDQDEARTILAEIEEAFTILSDSEKRRKYDESHGILSSESVYQSYHSGNHAVAAFSRDNEEKAKHDDYFGFDDPFRKVISKETQTKSEPAPQQPSEPSPIEKLKTLQSVSQSMSGPKNFQSTKAYELNPEMEEKITKAELVNGAFLKSVREYKKVSAEEIMDNLKISKNYLVALEDDDIQKLPANVFVRGFVIQYAKYLKMSYEKVGTAYMNYLKSRRPT